MASLSDRELVEYCGICYEAARRGRQNWLERSRRNWELYNNEMDTTDKERWQSQVPIPKVPVAIEFLANNFKAALVDAGQFYSFKVSPKPLSWVGTVLSVWMDNWLERSNFHNVFYEAIKGGTFLSRLCLCVYWEEAYKELSPVDAIMLGQEPPSPDKSKLHLSAVDPMQLFPDPTEQNAWIIREVLMDADDLLEEAEKPDTDYRLSEVRKVLGMDQEPEDYRYNRDAKGDDPEAEADWRKRVTLWEFYGKVVDRDGRRVEKHGCFTVANGTHLVKPLKEYAYAPDYMSPLVCGSITRQPFKQDARSIIDDVAPLAEAVNDYANGMLDAAQFEMARFFEVDVEVLEDPEELAEGAKPGLLIKRDPDADPNRKAVTMVETGQIPRDSLPIIQFLTYLFEESSQSTEIARGVPARGGSKDETATEFSGKLARASAGMQHLARNVEASWLEPALQQILDMILLHQPRALRDPEELLARLGGAQSMEAQERVALIMAMSNEQLHDFVKRHVQVSVRGMSATLEQRQMLEKLQIALGMLTPIPSLAQRVDPNAVAELVFKSLNVDPKRFLLDEQALAAGQPGMATPEMIGAGAGQPMPMQPMQPMQGQLPNLQVVNQ